MIDLLTRLTSINGVSGSEEAAAQAISKEIKDFVDEIKIDALGNLICIKRGTGKKIMLAAHMDEVGIMITHIEDNGFLRFAGVGGINHFYSLYQRVVFKDGITGVVGYEEQLEELKDLKVERMYIDIGCSTKEEAQKKLRVGDEAAFTGNLTVNGSTVISKALDDRAGCVVLIEAAKLLKDTQNEIYYVFTVQEELGLRGAKTAAYSINPDIAFVVDVTGTGDTPKAKPNPVKCGSGPIIKVMDKASIIHPEVKNLLIDAAKSIDIPYQLKAASMGGTDAGAITLSRDGVPTGSVAIPCRYLHSPVEVISIDDLSNTVKLVQAAIIRLSIK